MKWMMVGFLVVFAGLCAVLAVHALRTGDVSASGEYRTRQTHPIHFWFTIGGYLFVVMLCLFAVCRVISGRAQL